MINTVSGGNSFANISAFVTSNGRILQKSLVNFAAGQRIMNPSNGLGDYFAGKSFNFQARGLEHARRELFQAKSILDLAQESIAMIFGDLNDILDLTQEYFSSNNSNNADIKKHLRNKISEIQSLVIQTRDNTVFGGRKLLEDSSANPLIDMNINPNGNGSDRFVISFGADMVVDMSNFNLDKGEDFAIGEIREQINRASKFMGTLAGFQRGVEAQISINEITSSNLTDAAGNVLGLDDMDEIFALTKRQIQQQAAVSMLSQGNMMRGSVLNLVKN